MYVVICVRVVTSNNKKYGLCLSGSVGPVGSGSLELLTLAGISLVAVSRFDTGIFSALQSPQPQYLTYVHEYQVR